MKWIKLDSVPSTNTTIAALIKNNSNRNDMVVIADYQEDRKGQGKNRWHSQHGENLLMSLLLFPAFMSASRQFHLSRISSLAICDLLNELGVTAAIKWPNDILTGQGKIAGILIENSISGSNISHSIIGIGLNLNQHKFPAFPVPATSLVLENGLTKDPGAVAKELWNFFSVRYGELINGNESVLVRDYQEKLYRIGQPVACMVNEIPRHGIIHGVNEFGELLLEMRGMTKAYGHQEVRVLISGDW